MTTTDQQQFIELRAKGFSYDNIASQLSVSKPTLIKWSKELELDIQNTRAVELDNLRKQYMITVEHRLKTLSEQLEKVTAAISKRDLSDVPTERLLLFQSRLLQQIAQEERPLEVSYEMPLVDVIPKPSKTFSV